MKKPVEKTCEHCGRKFLTFERGKRFCSLSCESDSKEPVESWRKKPAANQPVCLECGEPIVQKTRRPRIFCCDRCRYHYHAKLKKPKTELTTQKCINCGKEFEMKNASNTKFCSPLCKQNWYNHPGEHRTEVFDKASEEYKIFLRNKIQKQLEIKKFICQTCGKEFKAKGLAAKNCPECSNKKRASASHNRQIKYRKAFEFMEKIKSTLNEKLKLVRKQIEELQIKAKAYEEVLKDFEGGGE
jgi:DNA-directed RNA polymerase subunit RPC12/RpoP